MKLKVTIVGDDWGYYTIEDYSSYYQDVAADEGKKFADMYFACGIFDDEFVEENNGKHFLFGHLESLTQSDYCPLHPYKEIIRYIVEKACQ